ncbi:uncharacterized protein EHS24_006794 [Apiotrichum porosum]|uniref:Uncharacterized protein n=1 Tax=Apiotrichum porosum TaxID=105984 RepID=A0A427XW56_9TREE|nr:uncharacterized protein EHS24_006794 [Apiotrichum porosum]RSH83136.1 hypothetical protein EHS24_006794 [Apiotrichum porosum]
MTLTAASRPIVQAQTPVSPPTSPRRNSTPLSAHPCPGFADLVHSVMNVYSARNETSRRHA